jgi:hypothetical protein
MALGDTYATLAELKVYANATKATFDDLLSDALDAASRGVELVTHRQFNDAGTVSARVYHPTSTSLVEVDDFHTVTGLIVKIDGDDDGTYDTTWTATDYELRPLNGIVGGQPGWPFSQVWSVGTQWFPRCAQRATVEVTARWGWAAVPLPVKQATLMLAEEIYKQKDSPFGIAGMDNYGAVRVRENPAIMRKLAPYVLDTAFEVV